MKVPFYLRAMLKPLLGAARYALTLALFCVVWWYDARYLNRAFDANLGLIKGVAGLVDGTGKAEAMMRAFAAEKMLLFAEGSGIIWAVGSAVAWAARRLLVSRVGTASRTPVVRQAAPPLDR